MTVIPLGKSKTLRMGQDLAILAFGSMVEPCRLLADQINATLINMRFVKPLDREAILSAARDHSCLVTVEENAIAGGAGSGINETLLASGCSIPILNIGLTDAFIQHGTRGECLRQANLDAEGILAQITQFLETEYRQEQSPTTAQHGTS